MAKSPLTDAQKRLQKHLDIATQVAIDYAAPEVPSLGNQTPQGLVEEFGRVNASRKALEKVEGILKERIKATSNNQKEITSDNFVYQKKVQERTALNQQSAKAHFEKEGILDQFMSTTEVETTTVKER